MSDDPLIIISSDGHAGALMADYRPYLEKRYRDEFDDFLVDWEHHGSRNFDPPALQARLNPEYVDEWTTKIVNTGRLDGYADPELRLKEVEKEGICAEVLFPDFGLPFELYSRSLAAARGYSLPDDDHKQASYRAFNRWLIDYISASPERFAALGIVSWHNVEAAVADIRAAHAGGLKGIVLGEFAPEMPLYHPDFADIWETIEELGMTVNSHSGFSSTTNRTLFTSSLPHPALSLRVWQPENTFFCHNILSHLIWGGVLERHPGVKCVFTEQGSAWVISALTYMNYSYEGSFFRSDYKDVIRLKPSEYFSRQCYLGSSLFSQAEVNARYDIGLNKMMLGMDFPHHEGTIVGTTRAYLQATLGAEHVPVNEARQILGENAASVYGFDLDQLAAVAEKAGMKPSEILIPPETDLFPRGDVHKPLIFS